MSLFSVNMYAVHNFWLSPVNRLHADSTCSPSISDQSNLFTEVYYNYRLMSKNFLRFYNNICNDNFFVVLMLVLM